jgi:hypothetical protein
MKECYFLKMLYFKTPNLHPFIEYGCLSIICWESVIGCMVSFILVKRFRLIDVLNLFLLFPHTVLCSMHVFTRTMCVFYVLACKHMHNIFTPPHFPSLMYMYYCSGQFFSFKHAPAIILTNIEKEEMRGGPAVSTKKPLSFLISKK